MSFDLKSLNLFVRAAAIGAIGRAGEEFDLSPTAATQRLQALELEVGAKLLNRTTRAVSLTPDGETFLTHAKRILDQVEDAKTAMSHSLGDISGSLRVTASASFGRSQIVPHVTEFLSLYPNVDLKLNLSDSIVDIVELGYDLAIRVGSLTSSSLLARKLAENPRVLVASSDYLVRRGVPKTPQDLADHSCIVLGEMKNWQLGDEAGTVHDVRVSGPFTTNFGEAVTETVINGLGIGMKSIWDVKPLIENGELSVVLDQYTVEPKWQIWAVRPPSRVITPRVKAFTEFFEKKFREADFDLCFDCDSDED